MFYETQIGDKLATRSIYDGFNRVTTSVNPPPEAIYLILTTLDGEIELWWGSDNLDQVINELRRYYKEVWQRENQIFIVAEIKHINM